MTGRRSGTIIMFLWSSKDQTSHWGNLIAQVHKGIILFVEAEVCQDLFSHASLNTAGTFSPLLTSTAFLSSSLFVIYLSSLRDKCSPACMGFEGGCSICSSVWLCHSLPKLLAGNSISNSFKHKQEAVSLQQPEYLSHEIPRCPGKFPWGNIPLINL